jgi:hypothetical protein
VGGSSAWSLRGGAFAAVVALHAFLVIALTVILRHPTQSSSAANFVSTLIFLSTPVPPVASTEQRRPQVANEVHALAPVEPPAVTPPPQIRFPSDVDTSIDWSAEAQRAAAAATIAPNAREFGRPAWAGPEQGLPHSAPAHMAGDQYRDQEGQWIAWVSDRCYLVSGVPPLGLPDVLARSIPTRTVCQGDSAPRGDLFKDLTAYRTYHPQ